MRLTNIAIRNFRSIRDIKIDITGNILGLYGTNGSGKTAIIDAVAILKDYVGLGWQKNIPYHPNRKFNEIGTSIEITIKKMNNFYTYGITYDDKGLLNEWLKKDGEELWSNPTPNHSIKTVLSQQYDEVSSLVLKLITQSILCIRDEKFHLRMPLALNFINNKKLPKDTFEDFSDRVYKLGLGITRLEYVNDEIIAYQHIQDGVDDIPIKLEEESYGIQKIIGLTMLFEMAIESKMIIMFDNIDSSIHENMFIDLVNMFKNETEAQLLFSAYNTSAMNNFLDPSEILLTKKNKEEIVIGKFESCKLNTLQEDYCSGIYGFIPENVYP